MPHTTLCVRGCACNVLARETVMSARTQRQRCENLADDAHIGKPFAESSRVDEEDFDCGGIESAQRRRRGTQHEQCVKTSTQIHTHDMHRHPHARMHTPHTARTRAHVMRHAVLDLLKYAEVTAATRMR